MVDRKQQEQLEATTFSRVRANSPVQMGNAAELGRGRISFFYSCSSCFQYEGGEGKQQGQLGRTTFSGVRANSPAGRSAARLGREEKGCFYCCLSCFEFNK